MKKLVGLGVVMGTTALVLSGCFSFIPNKMREEAILVEKDKAKALEVDIDLGVGEMNVSSGAKEWVEGNAEYNVKKLAPQVDYDVHGDTGEVEIKHKGSTRLGLSNIKNTWAIQLNDSIPMDLTVETGASLANLDLQGLQLEKLDIEAGVGDLTVNLGGDWKKSFTTTIETGVGQTTVILPSKVGVKLTTEKGIGSSKVEGLMSKGNGVFVNEAYDTADVVLEVNSELGIGEITFKLDR